MTDNQEYCGEPEYIKDLNIDPPPPYCHDETGDCNNGIPNQKAVDGLDLGWLKEAAQFRKNGYGSEALCDPMLKGNILNDLNSPDRDVIYRYSCALRGTDEAVTDMFKNIVVIDENMKAWPVPIMWATQERAVTKLLQTNVRKDNSLIVDRIKLPHMAIYSSGYSFAPNRYIYHKAINWMRDTTGKPGFTYQEKHHPKDTVYGISGGIPIDITYTLWIWTLYQIDMNQIFEQIMPKIAPMGYIRVRGVPWEIGVKLNSISKAADTSPGDQTLRVFKSQIDMVAETYIPQGIKRNKSVLSTRVEIAEGVDEDRINKVIARLEEKVKELK